MPTAADEDPPFELVPGDLASGLLILCDHATNRVPPPWGDLGLPAQQFARHIAYDIGAEHVARGLAARFGAPMLMTRYSRLVIDPNRGEDDPTLVMRLSDGAVVPGNAAADAAERARRIERLHRPYHEAIADALDRMLATGVVPAVVSIHSFTPFWKDVARPWQVAVLWDADPRLPLPLVAALAAGGDLAVGDNQPYDGALKNDTLYRHATRRGLAHALIEVRQDLIEMADGADAWAARLHGALAPLLARPETHEVRRFGSRTGPVEPWTADETG